MDFVDTANGPVGRTARVVVGLAMIGVGLALGGGWIALAVVGLVALAAGASATCLVAPLFHRPLRAAGPRGS